VQFVTASSRIFNGTDPTFVGTECDGPTPAECCHKAPPVDSRCVINAVRNISVYVPSRYVDGDAAPVMIMQDGPGYFAEVSYALDNLVGNANASRRLPVFIPISIENGGCDAIGAERGLEYDTMSDRYARFVTEEVMPAVLADAAVRAAFPGLRFSADPGQRAAFGCSSGGAAAMTMAFMRPDLFRRVAAYSATLVDQQNHADETGAFAAYPQGAWSYHSGLQLLSSSGALPLRVFHSANELDLGYNLSASAVDDKAPFANNTLGDPNEWQDSHHNWLIANNRTAAAMHTAGIPYRHVYALGAHHCEQDVLLSTLADTLVWLWQ
jgi:S-formylglutathione hydrolase FrmB